MGPGAAEGAATVTTMRQGEGTTNPGEAKGRWQALGSAPLGAAESDDWATTIAERLGLAFPPSRRAFLEERLWARVRALGLAGPALYRAYLLKRPDEWDALADLLVVTESSFFREEASFRALHERIIPELVQRRETTGALRRELALWSAGCSTGEEPYTLAMIALETLPNPALWEVRVLGSDLSGRNIARARAGVYDARRLANLPSPWRQRHAAGDEGAREVRMGATVRAVTTFRQHNLCGEDWPIGSQDVVVCQNVIIYFRREDQVRVLNRLYDTLRPGGYLLVGATELPTAPIRPGLTPVRVGDTLAYHRPHSRWA